MVKTLPSVFRVQAGSLVRELSSHMHCGKKKKKKNTTENRSNMVTNSIKTVKIVHVKKNLKKVIFVLFSKYSLNYS